jgi:hypothetical protein
LDSRALNGSSTVAVVSTANAPPARAPSTQLPLLTAWWTPWKLSTSDAPVVEVR